MEARCKTGIFFALRRSGGLGTTSGWGNDVPAESGYLRNVYFVPADRQETWIVVTVMNKGLAAANPLL
jgi:hypothetical protein